MKKILILLFFCMPVYSIKIPGTYKCNEVRITRYKGNKIIRKGFKTPALFLKFEPGLLTLTGRHSDYYLSESFIITRASRDTLHAEVKLRDKNEEVIMVSKNDTLLIDFTYYENDNPVRTTAELLIEPIQKKGKTRKKSAVRPQNGQKQPEKLTKDLLGR